MILPYNHLFFVSIKKIVDPPPSIRLDDRDAMIEMR